MTIFFIHLIVLFFVSSIFAANGYRILGIFPLTLKSHDTYCQSVTKVLAKRGHHVDVIATTEMQNPPENYTVIYNVFSLVRHVTIDLSIQKVSTTYSLDPVKYVSHELGNSVCEILANEEIQKIIRDMKAKADYDLVITEVCFDLFSILRKLSCGFYIFIKVPISSMCHNF